MKIFTHSNFFIYKRQRKRQEIPRLFEDKKFAQCNMHLTGRRGCHWGRGWHSDLFCRSSLRGLTTGMGTHLHVAPASGPCPASGRPSGGASPCAHHRLHQKTCETEAHLHAPNTVSTGCTRYRGRSGPTSI